MTETKLYAVAADWLQPAFALGELVYLEGYNEPVPVQELYYTLDEYEGQSAWLYDAGGYRNLESELKRESWPDPVQAPSPASYSAGDDFDPFLDESDLP